MEFKFEYTRQRGEKHNYHVTVNLMQHSETGAYAYSAMVYRGPDFVGPLARWPLIERTPDSAAAEATALIKADIEDLVGIRE